MLPLLVTIAATTPMEQEMKTYFRGELDAAGTALFLGGASALASSFFWTVVEDDDRFFEGMAYPIAIVGAIELAIAAVLYWRTPDQVDRLTEQLKTNPTAYYTEERARMEGVMAGFGIYKWVEIGLGVAGIATAATGHVLDQPLVAGIGWGTALQAALALVFDLFAEARADVYQAALAR